MTPFRWGILGTGYVARKFALGLRASEAMSVGAVASRSAAKAQAFANALGGGVQTCESYAQAVRMADVDAFYIATPPNTHRELAALCLEAQKPVLVEKPFTADAQDARAIVEAARAGKVFCMEAMWTRFLPVWRKVKQLVDQGVVGDIKMLTGSFASPEAFSPQNNLFNPVLGGGALLDRAVYPLSLAFDLLGPPEAVMGDAVMGPSGVDEQAALVLRYGNGALGSFTASLRTLAPNDFVIMGSQAQIKIEGPIYRPSKFSIVPVHELERTGDAGFSRSEALKESGLVQGAYQRLSSLASPLLKRHTKNIGAYYAGNGYHYEALEVMRCVRAGLSESPLMPLGHSLAIMETVETLRAKWSARGH